jgi:hypothetical protein
LARCAEVLGDDGIPGVPPPGFAGDDAAGGTAAGIILARSGSDSR